MRKPFATLGCTVQTHVKPDTCQTWDTHSKAGLNIRTSMEHHCCFKVYIVRTNKSNEDKQHGIFQAPIHNKPHSIPQKMVIQAAQQLTSALQGNVAPETKAAEVLWRVSKLFTKIASAKASAAKAKEQQIQLQTHPEERHAIPFPREAEPNPRVEISLPRVTAVLEADNCAAKIVASPPKQWQVAQAPATLSQSQLPRKNMQSSTARPNYISQDEKQSHPQETCHQITEHHARGNAGMH
jgi:hypothetical protein